MILIGGIQQTYFPAAVKTDKKNLISINFNPINFQRYMRVGTHLGHDDLKGQLAQSIVYRENYCQNAPIICCVLLIKTIQNTILINTDPGKLSLYMSIVMSKCYKYIRYQLAWIIAHSVNLNKKLITCYLHRLINSVSLPVLTEYRST